MDTKADLSVGGDSASFEGSSTIIGKAVDGSSSRL